MTESKNNTCVLIKKSDLDELNANHPNRKLEEKINQLKNEIAKLNSENRSLKLQIKEFELHPIIQINPMELKLNLFEMTKTLGSSVYSYNAIKYSQFMEGVNIKLDENLRKQISSISKLISDKCIKYAKDTAVAQREMDLKRLAVNIDRMSLTQKLKFLFNKKKYDIIKAIC